MRNLYRNILMLVVFSVFVISPTFAQEPSPTTTNGWVSTCLHAETLKGRREITGSGFPIGKDIYIVSITSNSKNKIITTGNQEYDAKLSSVANTKYVSGVMDYLEGSAKITSTDGNIKVAVNSHPPKGSIWKSRLSVTFYAFYENEPAKTVQSLGTGGTVGGLQQGIFNFSQTGKASDSAKKCTTVKWDPEGRVFDANTLEPMDNISVSLLDTTKKLYKEDALVNPDVTTEAGVFSFFAKEGDYILSVQKPPAGYQIVNFENQINPNFKKAYSNIYKPEEVVVERIDTDKEKSQGFPDIEHRDIALVSEKGRTVRELTVSNIEVANGNEYHYFGEVSHPLTNITVKQGETVVSTFSADEYGRYSFDITMEMIDPQKPIDVSYQKVDLTQNTQTNIFFKIWDTVLGKVLAQVKDTVTVRTQPILKTVQGYAMDGNGGVIPNAIVNLRFSGSNTLSYQTKADEKGYFSIPEGRVPVFPYYLEYINPVGKTVQKKETSDFAKQNQSGQKKTLNPSGGVPSGNKQFPIDSAQSNREERLDINIVVTIGALIVLLILGAFTVYYIQKKKNDGPSNLI